MVDLFQPFTQRDVTLRNRIVVSPMCQYSTGPDGIATDWHFVHLGSRAVGGAGLVFVEATSVQPRGRLSLGDTGIWGEEHTGPLARIARFVKEQGAVSGIQLAHGGRKAWSSDKGRGPETPLGPSAIPFDHDWVVPEEASLGDLDGVVAAFREGARRAREAGFEVAEIHGAHGYLLHSFLSPLSNRRRDEYGGSLENRARLLRRVVTAVREEWPARLPLWVRLSCSDWAPGGLTVEECAEALEPLRELVDVVDCSSGGGVPQQKITVGPGYQVPFAEHLKKAGFVTCAVGMLTDPRQCEAVLREGRADLVALARQELRDPYFPLHAAQALGVELDYWPKQYLRGK